MPPTVHSSPVCTLSICGRRIRFLPEAKPRMQVNGFVECLKQFVLLFSEENQQMALRVSHENHLRAKEI